MEQSIKISKKNSKSRIYLCKKRFANDNNIVEKEFLLGIGCTAQSEYLIDKYYRGSIGDEIGEFSSRGKVNESTNSKKRAGYKLISF